MFPIKKCAIFICVFCLDFDMFAANFLIESSTFCLYMKFVAGCLVHLVPPKLKFEPATSIAIERFSLLLYDGIEALHMLFTD